MRLADAEKDLTAVLEKFPLDRVTWNNLGLVYWLDGRFPESITAYGKTLSPVATRFAEIAERVLLETAKA